MYSGVLFYGIVQEDPYEEQQRREIEENEPDIFDRADEDYKGINE